MQITCTDRIDRENPLEFVSDAIDKFRELNEEVGFTQKEYHFPKDELLQAIYVAFNERQHPRFLYGHIVWDFDANRAELFVGEYEDKMRKIVVSAKPVKVFSGRFLK